MMRSVNMFLQATLTAGVIAMLMGCEDNSNSLDKFNVGSNNRDVIVALGDSVTAGSEIDKPAYPERLAGMLGCRVINAGNGGDESAAGVAKIQSLLTQHRPGFVTIMYGINDIKHGVDRDTTINNLRTMIVAAKNNQSVVLLATITPEYKFGPDFDDRHAALNVRIRQLAAEQSVILVDVEKRFLEEDPSLLLDDGFHPNPAGEQIIAETFWDKLK